MFPFSLTETIKMTTTFSDKTPPSVVQVGNSIILHSCLTGPEAIFLTFAEETIQYLLKQNKKLIYLGTSEHEQKCFSDWVANTFPSTQLSSEQFNLVTIIISIWMKAKVFIQNELKISQNQESIEDEKFWHTYANQLECEFRLQGKSRTVFTERQVIHLLTVLDNIRKIEHAS